MLIKITELNRDNNGQKVSVEYTDYKQSHIYKFKYVKMIKYSEMLIPLLENVWKWYIVLICLTN